MMFIAAAIIGSVVCVTGDNNAAFGQKRNQNTHYKISPKRIRQLKVQTVFQMMVLRHYVPNVALSHNINDDNIIARQQ